MDKPRSTLFRFTIRDLLWLMVVVGLLIGWVGERRYSRLVRLAIAGCRNFGTPRSVTSVSDTFDGFDVEVRVSRSP